jgi:hypothetical protein
VGWWSFAAAKGLWALGGNIMNVIIVWLSITVREFGLYGMELQTLLLREAYCMQVLQCSAVIITSI